MTDRYYCTSVEMRKVPTPKFFKRCGLWMEYNPNLEMFRVNHEEGISREIMGYTPHRKALISAVAKWVRGNNVRNDT